MAKWAEAQRRESGPYDPDRLPRPAPGKTDEAVDAQQRVDQLAESEHREDANVAQPQATRPEPVPRYQALFVLRVVDPKLQGGHEAAISAREDAEAAEPAAGPPEPAK